MKHTKHGILTSAGIYSAGQLEVGVPPATLPGLMDLALHYRYTHLWLHESTNLAYSLADIPAALPADVWDLGENNKFVSVQRNGQHKGSLASVTGRRLRPYRTPNTRLIFTRQSNWPWDGLAAADQYNLIDSIEGKLGVPMAGSPTSVGLRYLELMNKSHYDEYFYKSDNVDWNQLRAASVPFLAYFPRITRRLVNGTRRRFKLHCFDRQASHPAVACSENMGTGEPDYFERPEFQKNRPGLWRLAEPASGQPELLPPLFPRAADWIPTPLLRVAALCGFQFQIKDALLWPAGKPVFERWAKSLWKIREEYPADSIERLSFKLIMNNVVGSTRLGDESDATLRPDWYATIVAGERAMVFYAAYKLYRDHQIVPCGAYADALYILSPEEAPELAAPGLLRPQSLGGYKHVWVLDVDAQVESILAAPIQNAAMRIGDLKKVVAERYGREL